MALTPPPDNAPFGTWLHYFLARNERSRAWLARQVGVNEATVKRWLDGINLPRVEKIQALIHALQIKTKDERAALYRAAKYLINEESLSEPTPNEVPPPHQTPPPPRNRHRQSSRTFIVGREAEVQYVDTFLGSEQHSRILNIYGPGGIGKTAVRRKLVTHGETHGLPVAVVDAQRANLSSIGILAEWGEQLAQDALNLEVLGAFRQASLDYDLTQLLMETHLGIENLYDTVGNPRHPQQLDTFFSTTGQHMSAALRRRVQSRFALERYLRGAETELTAQFVKALTEIEERTTPLVMIDTYEVAQDTVDEWLQQSLVPALEAGKTRLLVFGRNPLKRVSFEWSELESLLAERGLPTLSEEAVRHYLNHFGVSDTARQTRIYTMTQGYPLLLVLMRQLANDVGGWDKMEEFDSGVSRDHLASQLLERILREQRVEEVREFLEKGVVSAWFTPEIIKEVLQIGSDEARRLFDRLRKHSFVEPHPYGLKFHDVIRELLDVRLQQTSRAEYDAIRQRLQNYFAGKSQAL